MYLALIAPGTYLDFGDSVAFRDGDSVVEQGILNDLGRISGRAQAAVRTLSPSDFARIVERGLGTEADFLPRVEPAQHSKGFSDDQTEFVHLAARDRVNILTSRAVRDRNFRRTVLRAYGERCAMTGLRLINGGGRAEVEAAHIRPVDKEGPDIVSNGIALSGTVHWMFDRGLVGLGDDLKILVSRQANDGDTIRSMMNSTGALIAPTRPADRPRRAFVAWHRENVFKQ